MLDKESTTALMNKLYFDWHSLDDDRCTSGWASLAKFTGTDFGVRNCQMAIELMGQAGLRQDRGSGEDPQGREACPDLRGHQPAQPSESLQVPHCPVNSQGTGL
jgi:hypothetical protein